MTLLQKAKEHLQQNKMSYWQHFCFAAKHGCRCILAGFYLLTHSCLPCFYRHAGSDLVQELNQVFTDWRKQKTNGFSSASETPVDKRSSD